MRYFDSFSNGVPDCQLARSEVGIETLIDFRADHAKAEAGGGEKLFATRRSRGQKEQRPTALNLHLMDDPARRMFGRECSFRET